MPRQREGYRESTQVRVKKDRRGGVKTVETPVCLCISACEALKLSMLCGRDSVRRLEKITTCFLLSLFSLCLPSFLHPRPLPLLSYCCLFLFTALLFLLFSQLLYLLISLFARCTDDHFWKIESIWWYGYLTDTMHLFLLLFLPLTLSLCTYWHFSLRSDLKTSLRTVSGPRQKRSNLKTMSSSPNSLWPSPRRQRVSVCLVCFYSCGYHVVFQSNKQCLSLCLSPLPHLLPSLPNSISISILLLCFHQPLKVRISHTHFHLVVFSHFSSSLFHPSFSPRGGHTAHLHYSAMLCQNSNSHEFMNKPPTPVVVYVVIYSVCPWLVVQRRRACIRVRWIGSWGQRERWTKGGG